MLSILTLEAVMPSISKIAFIFLVPDDLPLLITYKKAPAYKSMNIWTIVIVDRLHFMPIRSGFDIYLKHIKE